MECEATVSGFTLPAEVPWCIGAVSWLQRENQTSWPCFHLGWKKPMNQTKLIALSCDALYFRLTYIVWLWQEESTRSRRKLNSVNKIHAFDVNVSSQIYSVEGIEKEYKSCLSNIEGCGWGPKWLLRLTVNQEWPQSVLFVKKNRLDRWIWRRSWGRLSERQVLLINHNSCMSKGTFAFA